MSFVFVNYYPTFDSQLETSMVSTTPFLVVDDENSISALSK